MAPLIGKDIVEKLFLERFALLCLDPLFHVRKVCAANFGDFSSVVGSESTEAVLLRKFFRYLTFISVLGEVEQGVNSCLSPKAWHFMLLVLYVHGSHYYQSSLEVDYWISVQL